MLESSVDCFPGRVVRCPVGRDDLLVGDSGCFDLGMLERGEQHGETFMLPIGERIVTDRQGPLCPALTATLRHQSSGSTTRQARAVRPGSIRWPVTTNSRYTLNWDEPV